MVKKQRNQVEFTNLTLKMHGLATMVKMMHLNQLYNSQMESLAPIPISRYPNSFTGPNCSSKESMLMPPVIKSVSFSNFGGNQMGLLSGSVNAMT